MKRLCTLIALAVVALAATSVAQAGNWPDKRLDAVATSVAGHPVSVWCESSWSDWIHTGDSIDEDWDPLQGFTYLSTPTIYLSPARCFTLHELVAGIDVGSLDASGAILTLAHESVHQRGITDEGVTDCTALPMVSSLAVDYFGIPASVRQPYVATVSKRVGVRVGGHTVTRTLRTHVVRYRSVANPYLARLAAGAHAWHKSAPAEYQGTC